MKLDIKHLNKVCMEMVKSGQNSHQEGDVNIKISGVECPWIFKGMWNNPQ